MEFIHLNKVNSSDRTYRISYSLEDSLLQESVRRFGILTPLCLLKGEQPVVITGFRRIEAAKQLGIRQIPCTFVETDERGALLIAINDNLKRPLNTIEKSYCIEKMVKLGFAMDDVYAVMKMINFPRQQKAVKTASAAATMEESARDFIVKWGLPVNIMEQMLAFEVEERADIIRTTDGLNITVSYLREVLHLMMLMKVKQGNIDFGRLQEAKNMDELKQRLKEALHPLLVTFEAKLRKIKSEAALPPNIHIDVDPAFEKESIDIRIRVRDRFEAEDALKKLDSLLKRGLFGNIFELTHGTPDRN
jgi:hypothetical protein